MTQIVKTKRSKGYKARKRYLRSGGCPSSIFAGNGQGRIWCNGAVDHEGEHWATKRVPTKKVPNPPVLKWGSKQSGYLYTLPNGLKPYTSKVANQAFQFNSTLEETIDNIESFKKSTAELSQLYNKVINQKMKSIAEDLGKAIWGVEKTPPLPNTTDHYVYISMLFTQAEADSIHHTALMTCLLDRLNNRLFKLRAIPFGKPVFTKEKVPYNNQIRYVVETKVRYVENYQEEQALKLQYATNDIYKVGGPAEKWASYIE